MIGSGRGHRVIQQSSKTAPSSPRSSAVPQTSTSISPETLVGPGDVSEDIDVLMTGLVDLGPLPDGAEVTAYGLVGSTGQLFAVGHTLALPGGITARPRDVVLWDGAAYSLALDGGLARTSPQYAACPSFHKARRIEAVRRVPDPVVFQNSAHP